MTPLPALPLADWLDPLLALAREAGTLILRWYGPGCVHAAKADGSPVTQADAAAEALITAGLQRLAPGIPIVAEEAVSAGAGPAEPGRRHWLVDPLDGTREFLACNGEFTVNIALVEDGEPVLGVVGAPALGAWWRGARGLGAERLDGDACTARAIGVRTPPAAGLTVLGSRSHADEAAMAAYLDGQRVAAFEAAGSSLKFCRIAEGLADLYPRFGRTMEWDTAAGHAILAAAGGSVCRLDGQPLRYGKPGHENPHFVARGGDAVSPRPAPPSLPRA